MKFEKFEDKKSKEAIQKLLRERINCLRKLLNEDVIYFAQDERITSIGGFPLYCCNDGKTLTTNILDAKIATKKNLKELKAFASSHQCVESMTDFYYIHFLIEETESLLSNYFD